MSGGAGRAHGSRTPDVGYLALVLHTHLPWLAHHGSWPVGEEWLYQAWAGSYLPLVEVLDRLADDGRHDVLALGVTPVLAAQLDDPYTLRQMHTWLGFWAERAHGLAGRDDPHLAELAAYEHRLATRAMQAFETRWRHGGSPVLRALADAGTVQLLGGPATHPFLPTLAEPVARFALRAGLDDASLRYGTRPGWIWSPECGYRPGLEQLFAAAGVRGFVVDQPNLAAAGRDRPADTGVAWRVAGSDVLVLARDAAVTDAIWSSQSGYPRGADYRDFHTFDHESGIRPARVTSVDTPARSKAPYDPVAAAAAAEKDAHDFVGVVRRRLGELAAARDGAPGLVTVAVDTELFGHWWHEGPRWLEQVVRLLPRAGVRLVTPDRIGELGLVGGDVPLGPGSWGAGKDWHLWAGPQVHDLVAQADAVQHRLLALVGGHDRPGERDEGLDQLAREALLLVSSDWAFMVSRDSAAAYARDRARAHAERFHALADAIEQRAPQEAARLAADLRAIDGPFGALDARTLRRG